jgi:Methyltransferase domain
MLPCRLCDGQTRHVFNRLILEKYDTPYFECLDCGSVQTEWPHWLAEAYRIPGVHIDVGQAARVLQTWLRLWFLLRNVGFDRSLKCLDYGGSAGLLTRLMRDSGYDYYAFDTYDRSKYANYFRVDSLADLAPALISAFEVFEHFPNPANSLAEMFASGPDLIAFTTQFYEGQGADWDYLVPYCGQHVFFYTEQGVSSFAASFGFKLVRSQDFWLLVRRNGRYAAAIEAAATRGIDPVFIGNHITCVGWGTEATVRDHAYAKERFLRELRMVGSSAPWQNMARRLGCWLVNGLRYPKR